MKSIASVSATLCLAALAGGCQSAGGGWFGGGGDDDPVAAVVNGEKIRVSELDEYVKEELFDRETGGGAPAQLYEARAGALDRLVTDRVLDDEAKRVGVSRDALIAQEISTLPQVTAEAVDKFYADNKDKMGGASLEEMRPTIREFLESQKRPEAIANIEQRASVEIAIEPPRLEVAAVGPSRGPASAPVTIVEFSDFQCPYCRRANPVIDELLEKYPNEVRVVYRHLPLDRIHPRARPAAEASLCAGDQDRFWEYHDVLFENPRALTDEDFVRYATELGLDPKVFRSCVVERRHRAAVDRDTEAAVKVGVTGTPAFIVNGILLSGAQPASQFIKVIDAELSRDAPEEG